MCLVKPQNVPGPLIVKDYPNQKIGCKIKTFFLFCWVQLLHKANLIWIPFLNGPQNFSHTSQGERQVMWYRSTLGAEYWEPYSVSTTAKSHFFYSLIWNPFSFSSSHHSQIPSLFKFLNTFFRNLPRHKTFSQTIQSSIFMNTVEKFPPFWQNNFINKARSFFSKKMVKNGLRCGSLSFNNAANLYNVLFTWKAPSIGRNLN